MERFCREVFLDLTNNINLPGWLEGRAILTPTNKEVDMINNMVQDWLPGDGLALTSADAVENAEDAFRFNMEYLNTLQPNGFPPHILNLKPGMLLRLLCNLNPRKASIMKLAWSSRAALTERFLSAELLSQKGKS